MSQARLIYAGVGEKILCGNGHHIATFIGTAYIGKPFSSSDIGDWQQEEPKIGQMPPHRCEKCGEEFCRGTMFRFAEGWRE